jgi:hypothetical protein
MEVSGQLRASRFGRFSLGVHWMRESVGPTANLDIALQKINIPNRHWDWTPGVQLRYLLSAPDSKIKHYE